MKLWPSRCSASTTVFFLLRGGTHPLRPLTAQTGSVVELGGLLKTQHSSWERRVRSAVSPVPSLVALHADAGWDEPPDTSL